MHKNIFILLMFSVFLPSIATASEIRLDTNKAEVRDEEEFVLNIVVYSEKTLNAIEGKLLFSNDLLEIREIIYGGSVINFWVEGPQIESPGIISFSGITPGGFSGSNNSIFRVLAKAKKDGNAFLSLSQVSALKNDGNATREPMSIRNIEIPIKLGDSKIRKEFFVDTEPPEDFTPMIASDLSIFDGKYFLVFETQDKGLGLDHFEVREGRLGWFKEAKSPYLLKYQGLDKNIYVKAVDGADNEKISVLPARVHKNWWEQYALSVIIILVSLFSVFIFKRAQRKK